MIEMQAWAADRSRLISGSALPFLIAAILLLTLNAFGSQRIGDEQPMLVELHVFWIAMILLPAIYGLQVGLFAFIIALLLYPMPQREIGESLVDYYAEISQLPLLWLIVVFVVGSARSAGIRKVNDVEEELREKKEVAERLSDEIQRMDQLLFDQKSAFAVERYTETYVESPSLRTSKAPASSGRENSKGVLEPFASRFENVAAELLEGPTLLLIIDQFGDMLILGGGSLIETAKVELISSIQPMLDCMSDPVIDRDVKISTGLGGPAISVGRRLDRSNEAQVIIIHFASENSLLSERVRIARNLLEASSIALAQRLEEAGLELVA